MIFCAGGTLLSDPEPGPVLKEATLRRLLSKTFTENDNSCYKQIYEVECHKNH